MLHGGGDDSVTGPQHAEQAEIDRFGSIGGEGDPAGILDTEKAGDSLSTLHHQTPCLQGKVMAASTRVGTIQAQRPFDGFAHLGGLRKRSGSIIEIDRLHGNSR